MEFETLLQILITATVQGITEFLPISSSGHLFFINKIFSWEDINLNFMISAHLGTLLAVTLYFRNEVKKYLKNSSIEQNLNDKKIGSDLNTSFEDLQRGQFPEKLLEEMNIPENSSNLEIMKEIEAKEKAFVDFQEASEPTQQSARPDLISQQQASPCLLYTSDAADE